MLQGITEMSFESSIPVSLKAPKLAHSKKINTIRHQRYKNAFNCLKVPLEKKCFVCVERIVFPYVHHFILTKHIVGV